MNIHWKDWFWNWSSNTLAICCEELTHLKRPWCWERLKAGGEGDDRGWDCWMASSLNGHESEQAPGAGDGQGDLVCCSPWGHEDLDTTEQPNWTALLLFICFKNVTCSYYNLILEVNSLYMIFYCGKLTAGHLFISHGCLPFSTCQEGWIGTKIDRWNPCPCMDQFSHGTLGFSFSARTLPCRKSRNGSLPWQTTWCHAQMLCDGRTHKGATLGKQDLDAVACMSSEFPGHSSALWCWIFFPCPLTHNSACYCVLKGISLLFSQMLVDFQLLVCLVGATASTWGFCGSIFTFSFLASMGLTSSSVFWVCGPRLTLAPWPKVQHLPERLALDI